MRRILGVVVVAMALGGAFVGARTLDRSRPDDWQFGVRAWLRTADVSPGDVVRVRVEADNDTAITYVVAKLNHSEVRLDGSGSTLEVGVPIQPDAWLGPTLVRLEVGVSNAIGENRTWLQLPIEIHSPEDRMWRRLAHVAQALAAVVLAIGFAYLLARSIPVGQIALGIAILVLVLVASAGQVAFVRPLLRTTSILGPEAALGFQTAWVVGILVGAWRGWSRRGVRGKQVAP